MQPQYINIPLPAGTYFIGDPTYVMKDIEEDGEIIHTKNGEHFIAFSWGDGDGCVIGGTKESDQIRDDSGLFGIVPESLWTDTTIVSRIKQGDSSLGVVATFSNPVLFKKVEDIVVVGNYAIDVSMYSTRMFDEYDHDADRPFDDVTGEETSWQLWGQYDKEGQLQKAGVEMDDEYWSRVGLNS